MRDLRVIKLIEQTQAFVEIDVILQSRHDGLTVFFFATHPHRLGQQFFRYGDRGPHMRILIYCDASYNKIRII